MNKYKRIEDKVQQLLKEYNFAQKEIQRLQKENNRSNEQLQLCNEQASQIHKKADALKIKAGSLQSDTKKDLEKRIDAYLKDIDKCLALLHS
ncbi:MAG: hypothetical protein WKG06_30215 [Segetibacter sp.]